MENVSFSRYLARRALALALLVGVSMAQALAQWQWVDGTGNRVFSDTPPPAGTPDKNILKRPGGDRGRAPGGTPPAETAGTAPPAAPVLKPVSAGTDKDLQARKKQAEQAEEARRKAEQDRLAAARADNCERAKRAKATLDSGVRLTTIGVQGEREFMDDKARTAEAQRLDNIIRLDCGPLPAQAATQ